MADKEVKTETTETHSEKIKPQEPEKTVTETRVTEGAVSAEPGAAVVKTTETESHKEK